MFYYMYRYLKLRGVTSSIPQTVAMHTIHPHRLRAIRGPNHIEDTSTLTLGFLT